MNTQELESLLTSTTIDEVIAAIEEPTRQSEHGWDLHNWTYWSSPASVCFLHWSEQGQPSDMLVAVRAPQSRRDRLTPLLADLPLPAKLVLLG